MVVVNRRANKNRRQRWKLQWLKPFVVEEYVVALVLVLLRLRLPFGNNDEDDESNSSILGVVPCFPFVLRILKAVFAQRWYRPFMVLI